MTAYLVGNARSGADDAPIRQWALFAPGVDGAIVTLPAHLDRTLPSRLGTFHLQAHVALPPALQGRPLTLVVPHLWGPVALRVGAVPIAPLDASSLFPLRPQPSHAFALPAAGDQGLDLDLAISYTWTQAAWIDVAPYVTASRGGGAGYAVLRATGELSSAFGTLAIGTIAFAYAVIFAFDRARRAHGWFAAQGFAASVFCLHSWGPTQWIVGGYDGGAMGLSLCGAIVFSLEFTAAHFALPRPSRRWWMALGLAVLLALTRGGPFVATRAFGPVVVAMVTLGIARQLWTLGAVVARGQASVDAPLILSCWMMLAGTASFDLVAWLALGEVAGGFRGAPFGLALFALLQSVTLSRHYFTALSEAERLNGALALQVDHLARKESELNHLNDELRRQVRARAEALSDALGRLAGAGRGAGLLSAGTLIDERYVVGRSLGAGGMGIVYEVTRRSDGRRLALKVLRGSPSADAMARFAQEAKLATTVNDPHVVGVLDAGISPQGFLYLVMELVEGAPLNRHRRRFGDRRWAAAVVASVARGLAAVHAQGIVHRDLKPANVLLLEDGVGLRVKLTDFGISTMETTSDAAWLAEGGTSTELAPTSRGGPPRPPEPGTDGGELRSRARTAAEPAVPLLEERLTRPGQVLGTPGYMAPELYVNGRSPQTSADVYSLGVLAFELFFGELPFDEPRILARAFALDTGPPASFAPALAGVAPELCALLEAALATDPSVRPTASAVAQASARAVAAMGDGGEVPDGVSRLA